MHACWLTCVCTLGSFLIHRSLTLAYMWTDDAFLLYTLKGIRLNHRNHVNIQQKEIHAQYLGTTSSVLWKLWKCKKKIYSMLYHNSVVGIYGLKSTRRLSFVSVNKVVVWLSIISCMSLRGYLASYHFSVREKFAQQNFSQVGPPLIHNWVNIREVWILCHAV